MVNDAIAVPGRGGGGDVRTPERGGWDVTSAVTITVDRYGEGTSWRH